MHNIHLIDAPTTSNFSHGTIINAAGYMSYKAVKNRDIAEYVSYFQCGRLPTHRKRAVSDMHMSPIPHIDGSPASLNSSCTGLLTPHSRALEHTIATTGGLLSSCCLPSPAIRCDVSRVPVLWYGVVQTSLSAVPVSAWLTQRPVCALCLLHLDMH